MKRILAALALTAALAACGPGNNFRDVEGVDSQEPDFVEVYSNVDEHPNLVLVCIRGAGFVTTSRDYEAVTRVERWDEFCQGKAGK